MIINLNEKLNIATKLEKLWSSYKTAESFSPLYQKELRANVITFLSLNPSLSPNGKKEAKKGSEPHAPYDLIDSQSNKTDHYRFFHKFFEVAGEKTPWTIMDMLYERESNQKEIEGKYNPKTINSEDKEFLLGQMKITFEILEYIKPKVVVVSNAGANRFIHSYLSELNLKQELPSAENKFVYKINDIPFITNESKYLGSRIHANNKAKTEILKNEIARILEITKA